jgi:hypothetical protein
VPTVEGTDYGLNGRMKENIRWFPSIGYGSVLVETQAVGGQ